MDAPALLQPYAFRGGAVAPNRLALAPLTNQQSADDGTCSDAERTFLARRARGGFGVVSTCASHVALDGKGFHGQLGVYSDDLLPGLTRLAESLRPALSLVQLYHAGSRGIAPDRWTASEVDGARAGTVADIELVIGQFRDAAVRARRAGFDGVELHGAHGYLLSQFLSSAFNRRNDEWGGSNANRARLIRSIARAVRAAVPPPFVVWVRLSPEDFGQARGLDLDETLEVASWLADDGVDAVHASLWDVRRPTAKRPGEHPIPIFREALPADVALVVAGRVWESREASLLLEAGADLVAVGRAGILDPDWPIRVVRDGLPPIRPPRTPEQLAAVDVSPRFVEYLRHFRGMVTE